MLYKGETIQVTLKQRDDAPPQPREDNSDDDGPPWPLPRVRREVCERVHARVQSALIGKVPVRDMLRRFDADGSGVLDAREVTRFARRVLRIAPVEIGDDVVAEIVAAMDGDGTGTISRDEFAEFAEKGVQCFHALKAQTPKKKPKLTRARKLHDVH